MKKVLKITGLVFAILVAAIVTLAMYNDVTPISMGIHSPVYQSGGNALAGFDVVSYFQGKPKVGNDKLAYTWNGNRWLFSSSENKEAFMAAPERFVPQFGGYCTKAVSTGFTAPGDPTVYTIWEEKLFIFSSEDVKSEFISNPVVIISACNKHWN
jgi:YHS domain-containing protein